MAFLSVLHLNGPDASQTITDDVGALWDFPPVSGIIIGSQTTSISKFGAGSLGKSAFFTSSYENFTDVEWTIYSWVRFDTLSGNQGIMGFDNWNGADTAVYLDNTAGRLKWSVSVDGTTQSADNVNGTKTSWNADQWYHIALTYDNSDGKYYGYVDGVKDFEHTATDMSGATDTRWTVTVGSGRGEVLGDGWIDEVIITNTNDYPNGTTFIPPTSEGGPPPPNEGTVSENFPLKQQAATGGVLGEAAADNTLPLKALNGVGGPPTGAGLTIQLTLPSKRLLAAMGVGNEGAAELELPLKTVEANDGMGVRLTLPALVLDAAGVNGRVATADLILPKLTAQGSVSSEILYGVNGILPRFQLDASLINSNAAEARLTLPRKLLLNEMTSGRTMAIDIVLPSLTMSGFGYPESILTAELELPSLQLIASGFQEELGQYRIWAMNTHNRALTEYENFDFDSFADFNGVILGAGSTGLHIISEDYNDDNGAQINAQMQFGKHSYGSSYMKRIPRAYFSYRSDGYSKITTETQGQGVREYLLPPNGNIEIQQRRLPIGKGPKSVHWQFGYENVDGADFAINSLILLPASLRRRII